MNGTRLAELAEPFEEQRMTHQPTHPATIPDTGPATTPATNPTSTMEFQLEGRLVASCGVEAMPGRPGRKRTSRVDWVLTNDERHE